MLSDLFPIDDDLFFFNPMYPRQSIDVDEEDLDLSSNGFDWEVFLNFEPKPVPIITAPVEDTSTILMCNEIVPETPQMSPVKRSLTGTIKLPTVGIIRTASPNENIPPSNSGKGRRNKRMKLTRRDHLVESDDDVVFVRMTSC